MFGTIGGNDYNYALFEGKGMEELRSMVPQVVNTIVLGVRVSQFNFSINYFIIDIIY